jgi:cyclohexanecarboxylate-CoA ligase
MTRAPARLTPHIAPARAGDYTAPGGAWDAPSLDVLLDGALERAAGELVVDESGARQDAGAVRAEVARLAGALTALGVGPGDTVGWQLPNGLDAALLPRACWRIGAVAAPIHHRALAADVAHALAVVRPAVLVAAPGSPAAEHGALAPGGAWRAAGEPVATPRSEPAGLAAVLFTSGSSGTPKAVLHDARALAYKARTMVDVHGLTRDDVVLMPAPLAHVSGLLNGVLVPGAAPCRTILMARWDPERALEHIARERVSFMVGPPTFFVSLMGAAGFSAAKVASLRLVSSGGAGVTEAFCKEAALRLGAAVKRTYGSTEAPTIATSRPGDDPAAARRHDGRAIGGVELRTVDPVTGADVEPGGRGELWVRGPEVCFGYADAAQTAEAFTADGWFRTGDLATLDAGGWLTIVGRLKDVIIRGGENVSTAEVEAVLESHPAVRSAVAAGYPDALMGERVGAAVVASEPFDLAACRAWFAARGIAGFKAPERIVLLDALPVLPTGKPDRAAVAALLAAGDPPAAR